MLAADPARCRRLGLEGQRRAAERFMLAHMLDGFERVLSGVLQSRP